MSLTKIWQNIVPSTMLSRLVSKSRGITIEVILKIWILNNLGLAFQTYLTIFNNQMQKDEQLEEDKILFKAIKEKETCLKAESKASVNFAITKSHSKLQRRVALKEKK